MFLNIGASIHHQIWSGKCIQNNNNAKHKSHCSGNNDLSQELSDFISFVIIVLVGKISSHVASSWLRTIVLYRAVISVGYPCKKSATLYAHQDNL